MKVGGQQFRSIWTDENTRQVQIIDQTRLPFAFVTTTLSTRDDVAHAIRAMQVRGAPLIGVAAAFGVALAMQRDGSDGAMEESIAVLQATRPTAVNLAWALAAMKQRLVTLPHHHRADAAWAYARKLADDDVATNEAIGNHGMEILRAWHDKLQRPVNILTHCNAGWLATVDWGTALACIYKAHDAGIPLHVWVDETRPRNQGLLTAWELREHGVPHTYIIDSAGGHLMQHAKVDVVLVGADRVSRTGDVANKIGTYLKALAAHDNGIPFYAALPVSTIDPALNDALADIEIEERAAMEVRTIVGTHELFANCGATENSPVVPAKAGTQSGQFHLSKSESDLKLDWTGSQPPLGRQRFETDADGKPQPTRDGQNKNTPNAAPVFILDARTPVSNPGFDVTPARLVTGIITERGVFAPDKLAASITTAK